VPARGSVRYTAALLGAARNGAILGGLSRSHSTRQLNRNGSLTPISLDLTSELIHDQRWSAKRRWLLESSTKE
jgi:hypothetical protein